MNNTTGELFEKLVEVMETLRSENGCPWDRKQTHESIKPYLIEEAYEVVEAIDENSPQKLKEELGDLLLQIVFHAQMATEADNFTIEDVVQSIYDKMIRRHPHVFGDTVVDGSDDVLINWEKIKKEEKKERKSILDGVPRKLPALLRAHRIQDKAAHVGFDWPDIAPVFEKLNEEMIEFREAYQSGDKDKVEEEFGDLIFSLVNLSRFLQINPEDALRRTIDKFVRRFHYIEKVLDESGGDLHDSTLEALDKIWEEAKDKVD